MSQGACGKPDCTSRDWGAIARGVLKMVTVPSVPAFPPENGGSPVCPRIPPAFPRIPDIACKYPHLRTYCADST